MTGGQVAIGVGGAALLVANQVTHTPLALGRVLSNVATLDTAAKTQFGELLFEALGVVALVIVAGLGDMGTKVAAVLLVTLWVLFLIAATSKKPVKGATSG